MANHINRVIQLVDVELIDVVGISTTLTQSQSENAIIVSRLWQRLNAEIHQIGNRLSSGSDWEKFGITYSQNHEYRYLAAIPFQQSMLLPAHMIRRHIARGRYACITHRGPMTNLPATIQSIYKEMLPERNLIPESREKAGLIQFERYDSRFHWNRPDSIIEIYVPIETG